MFIQKNENSLKQHSFLLLELSARPYLYELSQKYKKNITQIRQIPEEEFEDWKKKGFDYIWMMGIWQLGETGLKHSLKIKEKFKKYIPDLSDEDIIGSPYCIVSYTINSSIGSRDDLIWFRSKLNSFGIKLILDFVPNHTSFDAPEIKSNPEFYIHSSQPIDLNQYNEEGIAYACLKKSNPWRDVAQLNLFNEEVRKWQIQILLSIAQVADGVRCDVPMCYLTKVFAQNWGVEPVPEHEFWEIAISQIKGKYPDFIFIGELYREYNDDLLLLGFDYVYDCCSFLDETLQILKQRNDNRYVRFTENHDEIRAIERYSNSVEKSNAFSAAILSHPGIRMLFQDQWLGKRNALGVHLKRSVPEEINFKVVKFYEKLFEILSMKALKCGEISYPSFSGNEKKFIFQWSFQEEKILFIINLSDSNQEGIIHVQPEYTFEFFSGKNIDSEQASKNELHFSSLPYQVQALISNNFKHI